MLDVGQRIGRWKILSLCDPYVFTKTGYTLNRYLCKCDCGNEKKVREDTLINGESQSCGCLSREYSKERMTTHGLSYTHLYSVWNDMLRRCYNSNRKDYKNYGGRGIKVCDRWLGDRGLQNFIDDMIQSYEEGLEIDRIDVDGDYSPENCRWVTRREQVINRRSFGSNFDTHFIEFDGKKLCISQWASELGIPSSIIVDRIGKLNWSVEKALTHPVRIKRIEVTVCDKVFNLKEIFKTVENLYYFAKKHKTTVQQLVADSLQDIGEVVVTTKRQSFTIYPNKESTVRICTSKYSEDFVTFIKQNRLELK